VSGVKFRGRHHLLGDEIDLVEDQHDLLVRVALLLSGFRVSGVQGYLAEQKQRQPRTLQ